MKLLRNTLSHVKNDCRSGCFLLCLLCTAVVSFFTVITLPSGEEGTVFSLILSLIQGSDSVGGSYSALNLFLQPQGDSLEMLVPILAAFPFVLSFTTKRRTGNVRFELARAGRSCFCTSHLISAVITGGLVLTVGYLLYGVCLTGFFPLTVEMDEVSALSATVKVLKELGGLFLYGGGSALLAYLLTFFSDNLYIVLCIPFLVNYILDYILDLLGRTFFTVYIPEADMYWVDNPLLFLRASGLQDASRLSSSGLRSLAVYLILAVVFLLAARATLEKRGDCCA